MQAGFAFLEAGSVRSKNTTNILFKNLLDTCVGCVAFWAFGFAFTGTGNEFIGSDCFFLIGCNDHIHYWFVLFVYSVTSVTVVSGAMAERTEVASYIMFSALCTGTVLCVFGKDIVYTVPVPVQSMRPTVHTASRVIVFKGFYNRL